MKYNDNMYRTWFESEVNNYIRKYHNDIFDKDQVKDFVSRKFSSDYQPSDVVEMYVEEFS